MKNKFILTPFFLDNYISEFESFFKTDWRLNKPTLSNESKIQNMIVLYKHLSLLVENTISKQNRPICIAGDCCSSIGVLSGLQKAGINPILIWLDAHADFNTWDTTPSGFLGGMPLAMLVGRGDQTIVNNINLKILSEDKIILSDARSLDPEEKDVLKKSNINHLSNVDELLNYSFQNFPIYIHFDADIINPIEAPAMKYPAPGGPRSTKLKKIFEYFVHNLNIVAVSMTTCWNTKSAKHIASQEISLDLLNSLLHK